MEISILSEEMEKLLSRISDDLVSTLVNLSGSLEDIECGTHIKIPTDTWPESKVRYDASWICELLQVSRSLLDLNMLLEGEDVTGDDNT